MLSDARDRGGPAQPLLVAEGLRKYFPVRGGLLNRQIATVQAVDDVSFSVRKGETLGIVGESGCGKSTTARLLMRLIEPDAGAIVFDGDPIGDRWMAPYETPYWRGPGRLSSSPTGPLCRPRAILVLRARCLCVGFGWRRR